MTQATTEPTTGQGTDDLYLEPERGLTRYWWIPAGLVVLLLLGGAALALALGPTYLPGLIFADDPPAATATPAPTATPPPTATPLPEAVLSAQPWTGGAPVGLVELTLSAPIAARVAHEPPPGFSYWCGDLLQTRQAYAWTGTGPAEVHWFLLRGPGAAFPATVTVAVDGQALDLPLALDAPTTLSAVLE
jgi:hypothetical protein